MKDSHGGGGSDSGASGEANWTSFSNLLPPTPRRPLWSHCHCPETNTSPPVMEHCVPGTHIPGVLPVLPQPPDWSLLLITTQQRAGQEILVPIQGSPLGTAAPPLTASRLCLGTTHRVTPPLSINLDLRTGLNNPKGTLPFQDEQDTLLLLEGKPQPLCRS